jgi:two-component system CheB/CheR fusion protein
MTQVDDFLVIGLGASAGGLEACHALLDAMPAESPMAFVLIQHLDPTHDSMMVDLLKGRTGLTVQEAAEGMQIAASHLYIIPPGAFLSVAGGLLHLSKPPMRHGVRLPFDFFLQSLAEAYGTRAVCVVLSGTGADGTLGLAAVKSRNGFVIVQDPDEAGYDGMPRSAILTGAVDAVLPVNEIPAAIHSCQKNRPAQEFEHPVSPDSGRDILPEVIELLRTNTRHDFTSYKTGTLERRIERRMGMSGIKADNAKQYIDVLRGGTGELEELARDLLINVTGFFRDPEVFQYLAQEVVPELVRNHSTNEPLRIWVAGCSTGEETYSLAMLFWEEISLSKRDIKLQVFASDVDQDAVSLARVGFYPKSIKSDLSSERLARFFTEEDLGYRIMPELRALVVFTTQDLLTDPPFAKLDMVSCRNLLIYLRLEAQENVIALFHFALREGGVLLLGSSETAGNTTGRFDVVSKRHRLYRHIGRKRGGDLRFPVGSRGMKVPDLPSHNPVLSRPVNLAELCGRLIIANYAPATLLINRKYECLYLMGPTDRYLRVPTGPTTNELLAMARPGISAKLRSGIQKAWHTNARVVSPGARLIENDQTISFSIAIEPVMNGAEQLLLICFIDEIRSTTNVPLLLTSSGSSRMVELERERDAVRVELQEAVRSLEISNEEHRVINEEALAVSEEYQSTNEELLASKEELQSLNEELTALNSQLQETLERQRTTSNDLQNVLYSTDAATLFLDTDLKIRFFTPATRSIFSLIASDVGRPLADLSSFSTDGSLLADAREVLKTQRPIECEIQSSDGSWYKRRILPYRTQQNNTEGVVITFADITDLQHTAEALEASKRRAELATISKSRFLAAASHDLRQPLQTLALLQGLMAKTISGVSEQKLIARLDETLGSMSGMLNTLLDINQIEAGTVRAEMRAFPINDILDRLRDEFAYYASAPLLRLRILPCSLLVHSDPQLLEQMIRNFLSNALKYTRSGKILLGCRRRGRVLRIETWDTGIGIPATDLDAIFEEYYQLDNTARERNRGLGLGLAIVRRLGGLLDHPIDVRSQRGSGSVFTVDVSIASIEMAKPNKAGPEDPARDSSAVKKTGAILVIENDSQVRDLLYLSLEDEGHRVEAGRDGLTAMELVEAGAIRPDIILTDYNLPSGMNGLDVIRNIRELFNREIPAIILTGDISTDALRNIASQRCVKLNKPVKPKELKSVIQRLLTTPQCSTSSRESHVSNKDTDIPRPVIFVVDDDPHVLSDLRRALEADGRLVESYQSSEEFLAAYRPGRDGCLLIDAYLPGMSGVDLLQHLHESDSELPSIMITGKSDVAVAVQAMKAGALDFIEKPIRYPELITSINQALRQAEGANQASACHEAAVNSLSSLTPRQRMIMEMILAGQPNKNIATDLGISQRTVEHHRAAIMKKSGCNSLPALARLALAAASSRTELASRR